MLKTQAGQLGILLMLAALFGGGGASHGLPNLVVQLAALTILALNFGAVRKFLVSAPRMLIVLVVMTLALPLVQLVPLPVSIWSALPGRQLVSEAYAFADGPQWAAVTVNYARTFVAFVGLIAPFAVIAIGWSLNERDLLRLLSLIIGLGLLNLAPGFVEVLTNNSQSLLYPANEMSGVMFGLFANRNSTGLFLDCCLLLLVALPASKRPALGALTKLLVAVLLITGVVLTQSRSSIALLTLPAGLALARAITTHLRASPIKLASAARELVASGLAGVMLIAIAPMLGETRLGTVADRFEQGDRQRPAMWEDARFSAQRYWPVGSGMGTFDEVFQVDESLEYISQRRAGRAHNDYLEVAIEAGAVGLAVIAGWALWIGFGAWRAMSSPPCWPATAGGGILLAMALQSALDFPMRNQTMLCLGAFALLLIASRHKTDPADRAVSAEAKR